VITADEIFQSNKAALDENVILLDQPTQWMAPKKEAIKKEIRRICRSERKMWDPTE